MKFLFAQKLTTRKRRCRQKGFLSHCMCLFLFSSLLSAQTSDTEKFTPKFNKLSMEDGLSQVTITAIVQDAAGYLWFGTQDGLNRYDGHEFKVYQPGKDNPRSLSNNSIWALYIDRQSTLWVGTYGGLNRYDAATDTFINYQHDPANPHSLSHNHIRSIHEDREGVLWVGTYTGGLNQFDRKKDTFVHYRNDPNDPGSLSNDMVNTIYEDSQGNLWVGTEDGLNRFDRANKKFVRYTLDLQDAGREIIRALYEDSKGTLWVGSFGKGLFAFNPEKQSFVHYYPRSIHASDPASKRIVAITEDDDSRLWIGTDGGGCFGIYDRSRLEYTQFEEASAYSYGIKSTRVFALYKSKNGIIWMGTYVDGIRRYDKYSLGFDTINTYQEGKNVLGFKNIRNFLEDERGNLWVGSESQGLIRKNRRTGSVKLFKNVINDPHSLASNRILKIYQDHSGTIWVGTADGWLHRYNSTLQNFTRYSLESDVGNDFPHGNVRGILEDHKGLFWVVSDTGGVHRFDRKQGSFIHYHNNKEDPASISSDRGFNIMEDHEGIIWISTFGGGLNKYVRGQDRFISYKNDPENLSGISFDQILSVFEDSKQRLWLTTDGGGIDQLNRESGVFNHYTTQQGLAHGTVYGMLEDDRGFLWMSHNKGLSRFNPEKAVFWNYDVNDGMQGNEYYGGSFYKGRSGHLYFGGIEGYTVFRSDQINDDPHPPPVLINSFQLFNREVGIGPLADGRTLLEKVVGQTDEITLSHKDYVLSFGYVALNYINPEKTQYAYRMEGLEESWNQVGDRRFATYTTLAPGKYVFHVKAANGSGVWNEQGTGLKITILPPFWQTWWFRGAVLVILVVLVVVIYRIKVRAIRARNRMLQELVKARTVELQLKNGELETQKTNLEQTLQELSDTKDQLISAAHRAGMADTATGVLHNVGNLLNSVNTSAAIIRETLTNSVLQKFFKANELLKQHENDMEEFVLKDPKGKKLLHYYLQLEAPFNVEHERLTGNIARLTQKIIAINEAVSAQQRFAKGHVFSEKMNLASMVEEALSLQTGMLGRHDIKLKKEFGDNVPEIKGQKTKVLQILVNLFKNAQEAMQELDTDKKVINIETSCDELNAYIKISDSGVGIEQQSMERIFAYGYTTKKAGNGFGLHSCANYMTEMGGRMWAESDGLGKGARFILKFPLKNESTSADKKSQDSNNTERPMQAVG